ncbi:MAG: gluconate 2-dehydrogenase subunit 3 family protein [Mycobacterium sp.]
MASDETVCGSGLSAPMLRRTVLGGLSLLPLAALIGGVPPAASGDPAYRFLTPHQAAVLDAATRRLVPGPEDSVFERGHPGAHEADVVRYLDTMLAAFSFSPPEVHAGGPWSNRAGGTEDFMAEFVPLDRAQTYAWQQRIATLQSQYTTGIALLDQLAGGDFTTISKTSQDNILAAGQAVSFTQLLFDHTIEGMYAVPEYGGNANLVGWRDIYWPGDVQPRGYTNAEVEAAQFDPIGIPPNGVIAMLLAGGWAQAIAKMGGKGGVNAGH